MTEATVERGAPHGPIPGVVAAGVRGRRPARYELSESMRSFLRAKYLRDDAAAVPEPTSTCSGFRTSADPTRAGWRYMRGGRKLCALALTAVLFLLLAIIPEARADSVVLAESGLLVGGNQSDTFSFSAPAAGTLDVRLSDLDWPSPLAQLSLSITSANQVLGTLTGAGEQDFTLGSAGTYYAHLTGQTTGVLDLGAYGVMVLFQSGMTAVPLPASVTLLFGGLAATAWSLRRRRGDTASTAQ